MPNIIINIPLYFTGITISLIYILNSCPSCRQQLLQLSGRALVQYPGDAGSIPSRNALELHFLQLVPVWVLYYIMYILMTLEFPTHYFDFHLLTSVNAKYYYLYLQQMASPVLFIENVSVQLAKDLSGRLATRQWETACHDLHDTHYPQHLGMSYTTVLKQQCLSDVELQNYTNRILSTQRLYNNIRNDFVALAITTILRC